MIISLRETVAPAIEPITAEEVATAARVEVADYSAQIGLAIATARRVCESKLRRSLITRRLELTLDGFPAGRRIGLVSPDVKSIVVFSYINQDGDTVAIDAPDYLVDFASVPCALMLAPDSVSWPDASTLHPAPVVISFTAGFGTAATDVPAEIRQWLIAVVARSLCDPCGGFVDDYDGMIDHHRVMVAR